MVRTVQNATSQASIVRDASKAAVCARPRHSHERTEQSRSFVASRRETKWPGVAAHVRVAAALQDAPLAVYPLLQRQTQSLFSAAVNHLMQHVLSGSGRTMSFIHATTHQQQHTAAELQPGDTWANVIRRLGIRDTQLLMYVRPVDNPTDFCGESAGGMNCSDRCDVGTVHMKGSVGDCCEEEHTQGVSGPHLETPDLDVDWAYMNSRGLEVQYYGVVAQNVAYPSGNGCYLLKTTTETGNPACHCMHYSLMRVCEGKALAEQTSDFWTREFR